VFPPNRDTQGGTAWLLVRPEGPVLVDVPALTDANLALLRGQARPGWIVLTSREGHGRVAALQRDLGWPVLLQEQEAFLLPEVACRHTFAGQHELGPGLRLLWTPGPTPGSCVLHAAAPHDLLFCGRLLLPVAPGRLAPLRSARTFHWPRLQRSLGRLRDWLPADRPPALASGGGLGALRGASLVPWHGL
jgi:glyoxylase-like metal-dependent hydrolase (beta-lactamase superfamily II)